MAAKSDVMVLTVRTRLGARLWQRAALGSAGATRHVGGGDIHTIETLTEAKIVGRDDDRRVCLRRRLTKRHAAIA
jgi:hypothetical protein